jgi:hypothetical protein
MSGDASGDAVMAVPPTGASEIIAACRAARGATYASQSEGAEVDESALKSNCAGQRQVLAKLRPGRGTVLLACPPPACSALGAPRGGKSPAVLGAEVDPHADAVLRELGCEPPQAPPAVLCEGVRAWMPRTAPYPPLPPGANAAPAKATSSRYARGAAFSLFVLVVSS